MNLKNLSITIIGVFCAEAHGEIYKCIDTNGGTTFQQKPCNENSKISEKIHINKNNKHGPVKLNEENRKTMS